MTTLAFINIGINPNILHFGSLVLSWHGFFTALGILVIILLGARQAKRYGFDEDLVYGTAVWAILGGILGARIVHVIDFWSFYSTDPLAILRIWTGGIGLLGAIIGASIGGALYAWRYRYPVGRILDIATPGILLGQAVGRIGDIINGEHLANFTSSPWAFRYTHPDSPAFGLGPMHPAIAYEMILDVVVFFITYKLIGRLRPNGMVFFSYLVLYGTGRFLIQFVRRDDVWFAGLQEAHVLSLTMLIVGVIFLATRARLASSDDAEEEKASATPSGT